MAVSEYDSEPIRGLPETPPEDETILWQGAPDGATVAWRCFHGFAVTIYFAALATIVSASALMNGASPLEAAARSLHLVVLGVGVLMLLRLAGWLVARTTVYTITSKRVVMRAGIALPVTLNIPFTRIAAADVKLLAQGYGDIALRPAEALPLSYVNLWPHVRGFRIRHPEPALRALPDARAVAERLVSAMVGAGVKGHAQMPQATASHAGLTDTHSGPVSGVPVAA